MRQRKRIDIGISGYLGRFFFYLISWNCANKRLSLVNLFRTNREFLLLHYILTR